MSTTIQRQGFNSAVVRVAISSLDPAAGLQEWKVAAKALAVETMAAVGWQNRIVAERATLDANCKFISVTVRSFKN